MRTKADYAGYKQGDTCPTCGVEARSGSVYCSVCLARQRVCQLKLRARRRTLGLCWCGRQALPNRKLCERCRSRSERNNRKRRSRRLDASGGPL